MDVETEFKLKTEIASRGQETKPHAEVGNAASPDRDERLFDLRFWDEQREQRTTCIKASVGMK